MPGTPQVLELEGRVGSVVAISSAAVYADALGRTLDESADEPSFPELPVSIPEVVGRALGERSHVVLACAGGTTFHPTSTANLAELVRLAGERPAPRSER